MEKKSSRPQWRGVIIHQGRWGWQAGLAQQTGLWAQILGESCGACPLLSVDYSWQWPVSHRLLIPHQTPVRSHLIPRCQRRLRKLRLSRAWMRGSGDCGCTWAKAQWCIWSEETNFSRGHKVCLSYRCHNLSWTDHFFKHLGSSPQGKLFHNQHCTQRLSKSPSSPEAWIFTIQE